MREAGSRSFGPKGHTRAKQPAPMLSTKVPLHNDSRLTPEIMSHSGFNSARCIELGHGHGHSYHREAAPGLENAPLSLVHHYALLHCYSKDLLSTCQDRPTLGPRRLMVVSKAQIAAPPAVKTSFMMSHGCTGGGVKENSARSILPVHPRNMPEPRALGLRPRAERRSIGEERTLSS